MPHRGRIPTLALSALISAAGIAAGQAPSPGPAPHRVQGGSWLSRLHARPACQCITCVPVPAKSKTTRYEYQSKLVEKCFVPARHNLLGRLHHREPGPDQPVAVQRRVLMKRAVAEQKKPSTTYEARTVGPK